MSIKELAAPALAGIGLIGLIVLLALRIDVSVLVPFEAALLGVAVGANLPIAFKKFGKKNK